MKLVSFDNSGEAQLGALIDDKVLVLSATAFYMESISDKDKNIVSDMMSFLVGGEKALDLARKIIEFARSNPDKAKWTDQRLLAPVPNPSKVLLLAGNYAEHVKEGGGTALEKQKTTPRVFMKPPSTTVIACQEPIIIPPNAVWIDWEAELAVVMGKTARFVSAQEAYDYVAGYTILNDVSERRLKLETDREPREGDRWFDWLNGKWFDTFAPMGPCMVTKDEIPDPHTMRISLSVNGEIKQDSNTGNMIFSVAELIEFISKLVTLEPGDIISTGTPEGTGIARGEKLKDGDVIEIELEKIGVLRNPVKAS